MRLRKVTTPATKTVQDLTADELLDRLQNAHYKLKEAIRLANFQDARKGHEAVAVYRDEVKRRMAAVDPHLRRAHG